METFNSNFVIQKLENAMSGFSPRILLQKQQLEDSGPFLWTSPEMELEVPGLVLEKAAQYLMQKL